MEARKKYQDNAIGIHRSLEGYFARQTSSDAALESAFLLTIAWPRGVSEP